MTIATDSALARLRKGFSGDCSMLDTAARRSGRSGFALLFDSNGENAEVIPLGDAGNVKVEKGSEPGSFAVTNGESEFETWNHAKPSAEHVNNPQRMGMEGSAAYTPITEKSFPAMASESHKRAEAAKGRFNPVQTADAAKQKQMAADAKRFNEQQIQRNTLIAQRMKEASDKMWKKGRIA